MNRRHKVLLLAARYAAEGLPYGFFTQALPVLPRDAGLSLRAISATSLRFLPWALKFLWAPFVDHRGTRRQWLLTLQTAAVAGALVLSQVDLSRGYLAVLGASPAPAGNGSIRRAHLLPSLRRLEGRHAARAVHARRRALLVCGLLQSASLLF